MKSRGPFCIRNAAADTFAMVVFCFITGMIIEILISGMTFEQSLASRTLSIPVNIAIAYFTVCSVIGYYAKVTNYHPLRL